MGRPRKGPRGWMTGPLDPLASLGSLLALAPCLRSSLLSLPPFLVALSHTRFPAILHHPDKRTMGLPAALPWSCWGHRALTQGILDPRKEGVQMLATCQGLSRGRCDEEDGLGLSSS